MRVIHYLSTSDMVQLDHGGLSTATYQNGSRLFLEGRASANVYVSFPQKFEYWKAHNISLTDFSGKFRPLMYVRDVYGPFFTARPRPVSFFTALPVPAHQKNSRPDLFAISAFGSIYYIYFNISIYNLIIKY